MRDIAAVVCMQQDLAILRRNGMEAWYLPQAQQTSVLEQTQPLPLLLASLPRFSFI